MSARGGFAGEFWGRAVGPWAAGGLGLVSERRRAETAGRGGGVACAAGWGPGAPWLRWDLVMEAVRMLSDVFTYAFLIALAAITLLTVPVRKRLRRCPQCRGRGQVVCSMCKGIGILGGSTRCTLCAGKKFERCPLCNGLKMVP